VISVPTLTNSRSLDLQNFAILESQIVRAAADHITQAQKLELGELCVALMRCAMVGDIDTHLATNSKIEILIGQAAHLDQASHVLSEKMRVYRQEWRKAHVLKDTISMAQMRVEQVQAIIAGNGDEAAKMSEAFFKLLQKQST
jgi:DNA-binding GntR family transcriptional regulator